MMFIFSVNMVFISARKKAAHMAADLQLARTQKCSV